METYTLLKDLTLGRGTGFIKVRISREWEGRKPGATHATTKTYIIIDEEVCFVDYYIYACVSSPELYRKLTLKAFMLC